MTSGPMQPMRSAHRSCNAWFSTFDFELHSRFEPCTWLQCAFTPSLALHFTPDVEATDMGRFQTWHFCSDARVLETFPCPHVSLAALLTCNTTSSVDRHTAPDTCVRACLLDRLQSGQNCFIWVRWTRSDLLVRLGVETYIHSEV
jgi:hypothetical protein